MESLHPLPFTPELVTTEDGSQTLFVPQLNEHYHSIKGAETESQHIFVDMGLKATTVAHPCVWEVGLGTGLNALKTLEYSQTTQRPLRYLGIEAYPLSWELVQRLQYAPTHRLEWEAIHQSPWEEAVDITPCFTLYKTATDIYQMPQKPLQGIDPAHWQPDIIYFDAFAPEKQPEMWSEALFGWLYAQLKPQGILTTYCAKGVVRRMLQGVGFEVERLPGPPGGKREILRATKLTPLHP